MTKVFGIGICLTVLSEVMAPPAMAACSSLSPPSNTTVTCSGSGVSAVAAQAASTGVTLNVDATAAGNFVHAINPVVFSVDTASTITSSGNLSLTGGGGTGTARGAVLLGLNNNNHISNAAGGIINTTGAFNDGMAANGSGNTLTNIGSITASGPNAYGMTAAWGQTNLVSRATRWSIRAAYPLRAVTHARHPSSVAAGRSTIPARSPPPAAPAPRPICKATTIS